MAVVSVSNQSAKTVTAGEFISEGQMIYIGNDDLAWNVDPNAPKSEIEAQRCRHELRMKDLQRVLAIIDED
jgi:hypothetical protein